MAAIAVAVLAVAGGIALWRGGGSTALETLQVANRVLERRVHELEGEVKELRLVNAALSIRTDFAAAFAPMLTWAEEHEANAAKRSDAALRLLGMMAGQLGAEPNGT